MLSFQGAVRWGWGHLVYHMPWVPSKKSADQTEDRTLTVGGGGRVRSKRGVSVALHGSKPGMEPGS